MSIRAINWVIEAFVDVSPKRVTPTMRHILTILANFAGDEDKAFPRQNTIARITGLSRTCVNQNLALMEKMGLISKEGRTRADKSTSSSEYTLHVDGPNNYDGPVNEDDTGGVNEDDMGDAPDDSGCPSGRQGGVNQDDTMNHHLEPSPEPKTRTAPKPRRTVWPSDYEDQFWNAYRKKVGRKDAMAKLAKVHKEDKVEFAAIMDGLRRYMAATKDWDKKYIKAPEVFINGEHWNDEFDAGPVKRPPPSNRPAI